MGLPDYRRTRNSVVFATKRFLVLQKFNNLPYMPLEDMIRRTIELLA